MQILPDDPVRRGRVKLLLLGAFFLLPMALSVIAYRFDWAPGATGNYGELIPPRVPPAVPLVAAGGGTVHMADLRGKWVLLQFDAPACDAYCERKLYFMRQVRRAMGRDLDRIERVWVVEGEGFPDPALQQASEGTRIVRANDAAFAAAFPAAPTRSAHLYVIDPRGNLMMRYPREPDPAGIIKDLQKMLKYVGD